MKFSIQYLIVIAYFIDIGKLNHDLLNNMYLQWRHLQWCTDTTMLEGQSFRSSVKVWGNLSSALQASLYKIYDRTWMLALLASSAQPFGPC